MAAYKSCPQSSVYPLPAAWAVNSKKIDTPVMTSMGLRARSSSHLASLPHLHRTFL